MIEAKVKPDSRILTVTAFTGYDYSKKEWRPVPADGEEEALRRWHATKDGVEVGDPYLEFRYAGALEAPAFNYVMAQPEAPAADLPVVIAEVEVPAVTEASQPGEAPAVEPDAPRRGRPRKGE